MNVLLVTQYFWPESFTVNSLAEEMQNRGHQVTVLTGFPNYPVGKFLKGYNPLFGVMREEKNGIQIIRIPIWPRGKSKFNLALNYISFVLSSFLFTWFLKIDSIDVIFCYAPSPVTSCLAAIFMKWRWRKKLYFWVQDLWPESVSAVGAMSSRLSTLIFGRIVQFIYRNCDKILIPSEGFRKSVFRWSGAEKNIVLVSNWADPFPKISEKPKWLSELPQGFRVAFAGNLGKAQDLPNLVRAAEILKNEKDIKWIVAGEGSEKAWLEEQVEKRGLKNQISIIGKKPYADMLPFFQTCDVLYVSLSDSPIFELTIPSKVQAYMSSGRPLLAALKGEGEGLINRANCGLVSSPQDAEHLAKNVIKFRNMKIEERDLLGKNGESYFLANFQQKDIVDQIENILLERI